MDNKIPDLYHPPGPCPQPVEGEVPETEIGPQCTPCPGHGSYVVRFYGATFTQSNKTGKVKTVNRYPALAVLNAN